MSRSASNPQPSPLIPHPSALRSQASGLRPQVSPLDSQPSAPGPQPFRPNIALIGMMGSGKSSVGVALAKALGWEFIDTDESIIAAAGREIPSIFEEDGEEAFRDLETIAIRQAVCGEHTVIATGGGAILRAENREILWRRCWVVWLSATSEEHASRVQKSERRPVLERYSDPVEGARKVLAAREPLYSLAHHTMQTTGLTIEEVVAGILASWEEAGDSERPTPLP